MTDMYAEYKKKLKGFEELKSLGDNPDLKKVYEIANKYELGYNVVEFVPKNVAKKMYVLHHYAKLNVLPILLILKANEKLLNKEMTNEQVLQNFIGLDKKTAKELVESIDEYYKKSREKFAKAVSTGIAAGLNAIFNKHYTTENLHWTDEQFFMKGFNDVIEREKHIDDIFSN